MLVTYNDLFNNKISLIEDKKNSFYEIIYTIYNGEKLKNK